MCQLRGFEMVPDDLVFALGRCEQTGKAAFEHTPANPAIGVEYEHFTVSGVLIEQVLENSFRWVAEFSDDPVQAFG